MKKIILLAILVSAIALTSIAQSAKYFIHLLGPPAPSVQNTYGVKQLSNSTYITAGASLPDNSNPNYFYGLFIKTDNYGNSNLDTTYLDTIYPQNVLNDIILEHNDTMILAGVVASTIDSSQRMWIVKADTSGQIFWSNYVGDSVLLQSQAYCMQKTFDGGYILGGYADGGSYPFGLIVKTNSNGQQLWEQRLDNGNGNGAWNIFYSMIMTPDSGFVLTGWGADLISIGHQLVRFTKLDKNGNIQKDTSYNFSSQFNNIGRSISITNDGGYIIGGYFNDDMHTNTGLLVKINSNFDTVWHKLILSPQNNSIVSILYKVVALSDGSIVGCGTISGGAAYMIKFDSNGTELWRRQFRLGVNPFRDYFYSMDTTSDGGFILSGRSEHNNGAYVPFVKTNCLGFVAPPTASFIDTSVNGYNVTFYNTSENTDTCYWNWGDGSTIQMIRLDTSAILHTYTNAGVYTVTLIAIACGEIDSISIPTPLLTVGVTNLNINEKQVFIYPNPNNGSFILSYNLNSTNSQFFIKDVIGRIVYTKNIAGIEGKETIDISSLCNGIYLWEVFNNKEVYSNGRIAIIK